MQSELADGYTCSELSKLAKAHMPRFSPGSDQTSFSRVEDGAFRTAQQQPRSFGKSLVHSTTPLAAFLYIFVIWRLLGSFKMHVSKMLKGWLKRRVEEARYTSSSHPEVTLFSLWGFAKAQLFPSRWAVWASNSGRTLSRRRLFIDSIR